MKLKTFFNLFVFLCSILVLSLNVTAQDEGGEAEKPKKEKKKKPKKAKKPLEELTVSGTITKKTGKKGDMYLLATANGNIRLPKPGKKDANPIDYSKYVDKKVTIKGKGYTRTKKGKDGAETKVIQLRTVSTIEEGDGGDGAADDAEKPAE